MRTIPTSDDSGERLILCEAYTNGHKAMEHGSVVYQKHILNQSSIYGMKVLMLDWDGSFLRIEYEDGVVDVKPNNKIENLRYFPHAKAREIYNFKG